MKKTKQKTLGNKSPAQHVALEGRYGVKLFNQKLIFLFLINQVICCGYSKEPSQWDSSFEHPKQMFKLMDKKIFTILRSNFLFMVKVLKFQTPSKNAWTNSSDCFYPVCYSYKHFVNSSPEYQHSIWEQREKSVLYFWTFTIFYVYFVIWRLAWEWNNAMQ